MITLHDTPVDSHTLLTYGPNSLQFWEAFHEVKDGLVLLGRQSYLTSPIYWS